MSGILFLCPTPIGNLQDISERVIKTLSEADAVAAEDTRHTGLLLDRLGIKKPLISYHKFNEKERSESLIKRLMEGEKIALVSDAGMPAISDPGQILVQKAHEAGITVTALPGPSAFVTALAVSGLSSRRFTFEGFLPEDREEAREVLDTLSLTPRTTIFYEAPHRLVKTLKVLEEAAGERPCVIVRELTKKFEEIRRGTLSELRVYFEENEPRGEFVILIEGSSREALEKARIERFSGLSLEEHMNLYRELPEKEAMKKVAADLGVSKRDIYDRLKK